MHLLKKRLMSIYDQYEAVIGLEVHVQLNTNSKAFCGDDASFGAPPNTHISAISLGHPGTLPRINKEQVNKAIRLGLALGCDIRKYNKFDRKNYFYADLPKGYQISQDTQPICLGGTVEIKINDTIKTIGVTRIHMEEDAGKSTHDLDPYNSLIDLNRAGVPLLEIVSEPDLRSADEAYAYLTEIRKLVRYVGVSDGNMDEGSLRADCNVSVRKKGETILNNRCEVKNVNSIRNAKRAIEYEIKRQIDIMEAGGSIDQQTLDFDAVSGKTSPLRSKENAHDYRYFPEPDLPPIILTDEYIATIKAELPELPKVLYEKFINEYGLNPYDAAILSDDRETAYYFLELIKCTQNYKGAANVLINAVKSYLNEQNLEITDFPITPKGISAYLALIDSGKVSNSIAKMKLFPALLENPEADPVALAEQLNLIQDADDDAIMGLIRAAIAAYPDKVTEYKNGKKGVLGLFMGEVMKLGKGKLDPKTANQLLTQELDK